MRRWPGGGHRRDGCQLGVGRRRRCTTFPQQPVDRLVVNVEGPVEGVVAPQAFEMPVDDGVEQRIDDGGEKSGGRLRRLTVVFRVRYLTAEEGGGGEGD